jgi:hypothetical protein
MTDDIETETTAYDELDWRLQTYVAARLAPSPDAVHRMRRAVVARATDIAAVQAFEARRLAEEAERRRLRHRGALDWIAASRRRGAAALLAASLVVGSSAAVFAASPGSPLYPTRVWLETVLLPAQQDARAAAHVDHLEQRVEDAEHAAGGGDPNGVAAALAAYRLEIEAALRDAEGDPEGLAQLRDALSVHVLLLEQLERDAPDGAQGAIHEAISDSKAATKEIDKSGTKATPLAAPTPPPAPTSAPTSGSSSQTTRDDR